MSYYSIAETTASGSSNSVVVPFPYLEQAHVHVYLDDVLVDDDTLEWTAENQITLPSTPAAGVIIKVQRNTPVDDIVSVFQNPSTLNSRDLNAAYRQLLYVTQEAFDVGAVTADQLATIVDYVDAAVASAQAAQAGAEGAQTAAEAAQAGAEGAQTAAEAAQAAVADIIAALTIPTSLIGKAKRVLTVKSDETGWELPDPKTIECTAVYNGLWSGSPYNNYAYYTLTLGVPMDTIPAGTRLVFTPPETVSAGACVIDVDGVAGSIGVLYGPDGNVLARYNDLMKNTVFTIERSESGSYKLVNSYHSPVQDLFYDGLVKISSLSNAQINVYQDDGHCVVLKSPATGAYRKVVLNSITLSNIFDGTVYVNGAPGVPANNKIYGVYLRDVTGSGQPRVELWETSSGVGVVSHAPMVNEIGIYTLQYPAGSGLRDDYARLIGWVYTGPTNITQSISGAILTVPVVSHYRRWWFAFYSDEVTYASQSNTSFKAFADSAACRFDFMMDGITFTPQVTFKARFLNLNATGTTVHLKVLAQGTTFDGQSFSAQSIESTQSLVASGITTLYATLGGAWPTGWFSVRPSWQIDGQTCNVYVSCTGFLAD